MQEDVSHSIRSRANNVIQQSANPRQKTLKFFLRPLSIVPRSTARRELVFNMLVGCWNDQTVTSSNYNSWNSRRFPISLNRSGFQWKSNANSKQCKPTFNLSLEPLCVTRNHSCRKLLTQRNAWRCHDTRVGHATVHPHDRYRRHGTSRDKGANHSVTVATERSCCYCDTPLWHGLYIMALSRVLLRSWQSLNLSINCLPL